ncbi:hypothetical protein BSNK01_06310 [Bacillaceae bacterium]
MPMSGLREKLRRYQVAAKEKSSPVTTGSDVWQQIGARLVQNDYGTYVRRTKACDLQGCFGRIPFSGVRNVEAETFELLTGKRIRGNFRVEDVLFFDTETTGLGTGAGASIFLFGIGYVRQDRFVIEQFFLRDMADERAMLADLCRLLQGFAYLVSFNGKAFDWPQLKTRLILSRMPPPAEEAFIHCDLLYFSRRLWKDELGSCRLQDIEHACLGIRRENDTPGHLAPVLYFDYLQKKDPAIVAPVFAHNEKDILALPALLVSFVQLLQGDRERLSERELFARGRLREDRGDWAEAVLDYETLLRREGNPGDRWRKRAMQALSVLYKRLARWDEAVALWERWIRMPDNWSIFPYVELAKYYEHRRKDFATAFEYTQEALYLLKEKRRRLRSSRRSPEEAPLQERLQRLLGKKERQESRLGERVSANKRPCAEPEQGSLFEYVLS